MTSATPTSKATYTIIQADGLYPVSDPPSLLTISCSPWPTKDEELEKQIFKPNSSQDYVLNYQQTYLWPTGTPTRKPWSDIDKTLRDQVDGIMVLKMGFTAADLELFPRLKV